VKQLLTPLRVTLSLVVIATLAAAILLSSPQPQTEGDDTYNVRRNDAIIPPNMLVLGGEEWVRTDVRPIPEVEVVEIPEVEVVELPRAEDIVDPAYREAFATGGPLVRRYTNPPEHIVVEINRLRSERNRKIREVIKSGVDVDVYRHWAAVYRKEYHDKADWLIQSQIDPTWAPHDERFQAKLRAQLPQPEADR
jgi:hypothetical protein